MLSVLRLNRICTITCESKLNSDFKLILNCDEFMPCDFFQFFYSNSYLDEFSDEADVWDETLPFLF